VTSWYESRIDKAIREAQERGDFDDLPGRGKPLPGYGGQYEEDWWVKDLVRRENITGVLPPSLLLRKEAYQLVKTLSEKTTESSVREYVADLNERIRLAQRGLVDGPPVALSTFDIDQTVHAWRAGTTGQ
jgi:hypothetical protein